MIEMKEMVYRKDRKIEVLYSGEYKGYKFAILNLGVHPTAYIENKNGFFEYDEANEKTYGENFPHGGFTFLSKCYWDENDKTEYLGWDYAHCGDFAGYNIGSDDPYLLSERQWTTAEIYEDVKKTIDFLSGISNDLSDEEIEKVLDCCGKKIPDCEKCPYTCNESNRRCYKVGADSLAYINRLKTEKQRAETQLKELLAALYQRTEKPFVLERKDIVELAKDYGIKEEEL